MFSGRGALAILKRLVDEALHCGLLGRCALQCRGEERCLLLGAEPAYSPTASLLHVRTSVIRCSGLFGRYGGTVAKRSRLRSSCDRRLAVIHGGSFAGLSRAACACWV